MMAVTKLERVHVRLKLTAVQLSEDEDARLIAHVAFKHGQELGSVLDDRKSFDLLLIMRGRTSWSCEWLLS